MHADLLELNKRLIRLRRTYPDFSDPQFDHGTATSDDDEGWLLVERGAVALVINFRERASGGRSRARPRRRRGSGRPRRRRLGPHSAWSAPAGSYVP